MLIAALPWTIAPLSIAAVACGALTLAWVGLERGRPWPRTPIDLPALAWALALILSATFALDRTASLGRLNKALFPALVPLAVLHTSAPRSWRRVIAVLLASSAVAWLVGSAMFVLAGASPDHRARGAVGHYMTFAGQLLLLLPVAVSIALGSRSLRWRVGAALAAVPGLFALAATFTRSAWIGMGVALAVMLGVRRPRALPILAGVVALAVVLAPHAYRARLASAFDPHHPTNIERTYMWSAGIRMFQDHPLTGVGLQDLKPIYERYRLPQAKESAGHLHSVPIQIAATMGSVGLVAYAALWTGLFVLAAAGLRRMPPERDVERAFRIGVLGALAGFAVAGLFEWNLGDEELLHPLFLLAGLSWSAWVAASAGSRSGAGARGASGGVEGSPPSPGRSPA